MKTFSFILFLELEMDEPHYEESTLSKDNSKIIAANAISCNENPCYDTMKRDCQIFAKNMHSRESGKEKWHAESGSKLSPSCFCYSGLVILICITASASLSLAILNFRKLNVVTSKNETPQDTMGRTS